MRIQTYAAGARILCNSWGTNRVSHESYGYDQTASSVDNFMYTHRDAIVVSAAGNRGACGHSGSIASPGTAKVSDACPTNENIC
jgi:hypothetical protein